MEYKILIIQKDQDVAQKLAHEIEQRLDVVVDKAYSVKESKLFLQAYKYFLTILDLDISDTLDADLIKYVSQKQPHIIALSSQLEKGKRQELFKKNIIDYIEKQSSQDQSYFAYLVSAVDRLIKNQNHEILVVDDSMMMRKQIQGVLENLFFKVTTVAHGEEAIGILRAQPKFSLVLTDYNMPVMDGLELTREIRTEFSKEELCIVALSANEDEAVSAQFLKHGANDFIKKPFSKEELSCRINNSIEALENIHTILNYAHRDFLTGLYNRRYFYEAVANTLMHIEESFSSNIAVAMVDIDHFKHINDTYGHDIGDKAIVVLADILRSSIAPQDIVARFGGEEFCLFIQDVTQQKAQEILERLRQNVAHFVLKINDETKISFTISIGAVMYDGDEDIDESINQADMALYNAKNNGRDQLVFAQKS